MKINNMNNEDAVKHVVSQLKEIATPALKGLCSDLETEAMVECFLIFITKNCETREVATEKGPDLFNAFLAGYVASCIAIKKIAEHEQLNRS